MSMYQLEMNFGYLPGEFVLVDGMEATIVEQLPTDPGQVWAYKVKIKNGEYRDTTIGHITPALPAFCRPKCECGVAKVGSGKHSDYCPQSRFE